MTTDIFSTADALYYPSIEFQNPNWLKAMALYYDKIYRIVPPTVDVNDSEEVKALIESEDIGSKLDPVPYASDASRFFLENIESGNWEAASLSYENDELLTFNERIHSAKVDHQVRELFNNLGYPNADEWISVPNEVASNYMLYLATHMAKSNSLSLLTDDFIPWTGTTYFNLDGKIDEFCGPLDSVRDAEDGSYLFSLILTGTIPLNISEIPGQEIIKFREKRKDEIANMRAEIENLQKQLRNIKDDKVVADKIFKAIETASSAISDYQRSADIIKAKEWFGLKLMGFPAPGILAGLLGLNPASTAILVGTGIALGAIYSLAATKEDIKKLSKSHPCSAIALMRRDFKGYTKGGGDINQYAFNCLEEYVND